MSMVIRHPEITTQRPNWLAGGLGFEPRLTESESAVLPLNYPPRASCDQEFRLFAPKTLKLLSSFYAWPPPIGPAAYQLHIATKSGGGHTPGTPWDAASASRQAAHALCRSRNLPLF